MRYAILLLLFLSHLASGDEVKIGLWNANAMFDVSTVNHRADDLRRFGEQFKGVDIVILDEVTSVAVVNAVRDKMGCAGYHMACSDFEQDDNDTSHLSTHFGMRS